MSREILTVRPGQPIPESWDASIYVGLRGSVSSVSGTPWLPEILALLRKLWTVEGRLVVFAPYLDEQNHQPKTPEVFTWGNRTEAIADVLILPSPQDTDPQWIEGAATARQGDQRVLWITPNDSAFSSSWANYANDSHLSTAKTPAEVVSKALDIIGGGASRAGGERDVPLHVWNTESFQRWYSAQVIAGNQLREARLVWTFHTGPKKQLLLYWALHVSMWVAAENRIKSNEVVVSRPDISVLALYKRRPVANDTLIVLVREFRSPASTPDGLVHELPSGSGSARVRPADQAVTEAEEETGIAIDVSRVRAYGSRQLAATMSAHHAHLFAVEITDAEITRLQETRGDTHGEDDTEQTRTEITTFGDLRGNRLVDWSTLGMISEIILEVHDDQ